MAWKRITSRKAAEAQRDEQLRLVSECAEADIERLWMEMNFRLLMESSLTGQVLWVDEVRLMEVAPAALPPSFIRRGASLLKRAGARVLGYLKGFFG